MDRIFVVAWKWNDGQGFHWGRDQEIIEKEARSQQQAEVKLYGEKHGYQVRQFEVDIPWPIKEGDFGKMAVDMFVQEAIEGKF